MHKIVMIQGMQYGSEAKGAIAAGVAKNWQPDTVVTAWGPNAGHTVSDGDFHFVSSMLATGALYPSTRTILIGPGSVVDFHKLTGEVETAGERLRGKILILHPQAAYLKPEHAEAERSLLRIGSTMKGTMAAVVAKMGRNIDSIVAGAYSKYWMELAHMAETVGLTVLISEHRYDQAVDDSRKLLIEGAQGFSLGIHGQFYPYCTSRDVSTAQLLADCRIPYPGTREQMAIIGVMRTYPIRVANRKNADGQDFTSGGIYEDQVELDWERDIGRQAELTTVTKLPRRIFSFSYEQVRQAARVIQPTMLALTFCDYLEEKPQFKTGEDWMNGRVSSLVHAIEDTMSKVGCVARIETVSYGPDLADIFLTTDTGALGRNAFNL